MKNKEEEVDSAQDICLKGARAICRAVGENPKQIVRLVSREGLPAWRRDGTGSWRALPEDLKAWMLVQRNRHLPAAGRIGAPAAPKAVADA